MSASIVPSSAMNRHYPLGVTPMLKCLAPLLALVACTSSPKGGVQWGDYESGLRQRIDSLTVCADLQAEFDTADANGAATKARTGHNNAELMKYLDARMRALGCY